MSTRWKEREFLVLVVVALVYGWALTTGKASEEQMNGLFNMLLVTAGGFQVSRGLAKAGNGKKKEESTGTPVVGGTS